MKKTAFYGSILAFAVIMGYVEFLIPFNIGVPGIKLGLANVVPLFLLYKKGFKEAFIVNTARILLCGILFGNVMSIVYSLSGGILALIVMFLLKKLPVFSTVGVSVGGAVAHNFGQLLAALWVIGLTAAVYYLPILTVVAVVTGFLVGIAATLLIRRVRLKD
jgi:heptaprenyl diphosphate synthase